MKTTKWTAGALAAVLLSTAGLPSALAAGDKNPNAVRLMDPAQVCYTGSGTVAEPYQILMARTPGKELPNTAPSKFWHGVLDDAKELNVTFEQRAGDVRTGELLCSYHYEEADIVPENWDQNFTKAFRLSPCTQWQWDQNSLEFSHVWKGDFSTYWTDWEYRINVEDITASPALAVPAEQQLHAGDLVTVTHYGDYRADETNRGQNYDVDFTATTSQAPDASIDFAAAYTPWSREMTVEPDGFLTFSGKDMMIYGGNYRVAKAVPMAKPELKAAGQDKQVELSWAAVAGATGYSIQQNGAAVAVLPADARTYTVQPLVNGETYTFTLTALCDGGNAISAPVRSIPNSAGSQNSRPGGQGAGDGSGAVTHPLGVQKTNAEGTMVSPKLDEIWLWFTHNVSGKDIRAQNLKLISLVGPDGTVSTTSYAVDPSVDFEHRQFLFLKLDQPLKPNTDYTIRIEAGIQANNGTATTAPQVLSFSTAAANFVDMQGHWAAGAVDFVTEKGLFNGTSEDHFSPELPLTRGMFVTVLWRMAGSPKADGQTAAFSDVANGSYYQESIAWASRNKIVNGISAGKFAPDAPVSREQLATILYRYQNCPASRGTVDAYSDAGQISGYARDAICWAVEQGLLSGVTTTTLVPGGTATRAQSAAILMRFTLMQS